MPLPTRPSSASPISRSGCSSPRPRAGPMSAIGPPRVAVNVVGLHRPGGRARVHRGASVRRGARRSCQTPAIPSAGAAGRLRPAGARARARPPHPGAIDAADVTLELAPRRGRLHLDRHRHDRARGHPGATINPSSSASTARHTRVGAAPARQTTNDDVSQTGWLGDVGRLSQDDLYRIRGRSPRDGHAPGPQRPPSPPRRSIRRHAHRRQRNDDAPSAARPAPLCDSRATAPTSFAISARYARSPVVFFEGRNVRLFDLSGAHVC